MKQTVGVACVWMDTWSLPDEKNRMYVNNMVYVRVLKMVFREVVYERQGHTLMDLILNKTSLLCVSVAVPSPVPACEPEPKTNGHYPAPRLSISSRATVVATMEAPSQGLQTVMKWKTVVAIFVVVVVYLVTGGLVFRALEQPFESRQKNTIALEKADFLREHVCVTQLELETLIQVGPVKKTVLPGS